MNLHQGQPDEGGRSEMTVLREHWVIECRLRDGKSDWIEWTDPITDYAELVALLAEERDDSPRNEFRVIHVVTRVADL